MATTLDNSNLTVDACPSPPRPEKEDTANHTSQESPKKDNPKEKPSNKSGKKDKAESNVYNNWNLNNCKDIHFGPTYNITVKDKNEKNNHSKHVLEKTPAIEQLLCRTDPVTTDIILHVSKSIGENWMTAARLLGFNESELHQFQEDNRIGGVKEIVYQVLLDWIQNKPEEAKLGILFTALWKAEEFYVVQKMSKKVQSNTTK